MIELDPEVGVVEADHDTRQMLADIPEIGSEAIEWKQPEGIAPIDTEIARVWTPDTGQYWNGAREIAPPFQEEGRRANFRHAFFHGREIIKRRCAGDDRSRIDRTSNDIANQLLVTVPNNDVEESEAVGGERFGVRAADDGPRAGAPVEFGQRVGEGTGLRVAADEYDVEIGRKPASGISYPVVRGVERLMSRPTAPNRYRLWGHAGKLLRHHEAIDGTREVPRRQR